MELTIHSAKIMPLFWALLAFLGSFNSERSVAQGIDPVLVAHCLDSALNVTVTNGVAYVAQGTRGFSIVDVRNPAAPVVLGGHAVSNAVSIAVQGSYAFVADLTNGLAIFSLANPALPELVSQVPLAGPVLDLAIVNGYAYVANGSNGLAVIDVRDPLHPTTVSYYTYAGSSEFDFSRVIWNGHYLFVLDNIRGPLILALSNPAEPQLAGHFPLGSYYISVAIRGETMFINQLVSSALYPMFTVVDVRDPANLHVLGGGLPDSSDFSSRFVVASKYIATWGAEVLTLSDYQSNSFRRVGAFRVDPMQEGPKQVTFWEVTHFWRATTVWIL
jgi:hypothetical protein